MWERGCRSPVLTKARAEPGRRKSRDRGKAPAVARRWEAAGCRAGGDDVPPAHPVLGSLLEAPQSCWGWGRASTQDCPLTSLDHLPPQCRKSESLVSQSSVSAAPAGAWAGTSLVHPTGCLGMLLTVWGMLSPGEADVGISSSPTRLLRSPKPFLSFAPRSPGRSQVMTPFVHMEHPGVPPGTRLSHGDHS